MKIDHRINSALSSVVKTFACNLARIQGVFEGTAATHYLQVYNLKAVPADGDNSAFLVHEEELPAGAKIFCEFGDLQLSTGCVVCVSSTSTSLTIATGTNKFNGTVEGDSAVDDTNHSSTGDYTSVASSLAVWADAAGPKRLVRLELTYLAGGPTTLYCLIYADDLAATRIVRSIALVAGADNDLWFGEHGLTPITRDGSTEYDACLVAVSESPTAFTPNTEFAIKGTYRG